MTADKRQRHAAIGVSQVGVGEFNDFRVVHLV
jgi:hypothetical protein